jgi:hypothetical protein
MFAQKIERSQKTAQSYRVYPSCSHHAGVFVASLIILITQLHYFVLSFHIKSERRRDCKTSLLQKHKIMKFTFVAMMFFYYGAFFVWGSHTANWVCEENPTDQSAQPDDANRLVNCTAWCEARPGDCPERRRNLKAVNTDDLVNVTPKCLHADYDLFVVSEQNHFALLATPPININDRSSSDCPNVVMHSIRAGEDRSQLEKSMATVDDSEVATVSNDAKLWVGARKLSLLVGAYEATEVGVNGSIEYDHIRNNCAAFPRGMLEHLDIPMDDRVVAFAAKHIIQSKMLERVRESPSFQTITVDGGERYFTPEMMKDEVALKLIELYH